MTIVRVSRRSELADRLLGPAKRNKFNAQPVTIDGHRFASKKEGDRYCTLKIMQQQKVIRGLTLQPRFTLMVNGSFCGTYIGDFRYWTNEGRIVVEDVKSEATATDLYVLKRKLMLAIYDIVIEEV
jgi:hypothetical protein